MLGAITVDLFESTGYQTSLFITRYSCTVYQITIENIMNDISIFHYSF